MKVAEITAIVSRIEGNRAQLVVEGNSQITLPLRYLPRGVAEKDKLYFEILNKGQYEGRRQNIAKALLTEILGQHEKQQDQKAKKEEG